MGLSEKLCEAEFPRRDELRAQLASVTAKQIIEDGTLALRCDSGPASRKKRLALEGCCRDSDGIFMSVLLHVHRQRFMHVLEILKYDGTPIVNPLLARDLVFGLPGKMFRRSPRDRGRKNLQPRFTAPHSSAPSAPFMPSPLRHGCKTGLLGPRPATAIYRSSSARRTWGLITTVTLLSNRLSAQAKAGHQLDPSQPP